MKFKCGCEFDKLDFDNIDLECSATWDLISSGYTKGVFQLEKNLGKRFSKEVAPSSISELSDLLSLIRPGCLEAPFREDPEKPGKFLSIISSYIKVKDGDLEAEYIDPVLEPIFSSTQGVPVYQEQIMRICTDFAGFNLQEADKARKAVGKKKKDVMEKVKKDFIKGALALGHKKDLAETVFSWIDKFSGYGFNKSHGVSYAMIAYQTAYAKRHFPIQFFKAMLTNSEGKQDSLEEIQELVHEAKLFDIKISPPCLRLKNADFALLDEKTIAFGLGHIKGVGKSAISSIKKAADCKSEDEFIKRAFAKGSKIKKNVVEALIKSGALDYLTKNRVEMLVKFRVLNDLTERERNFIFKYVENNTNDILGSLQPLLDSKVPNVRRKEKIKEQLSGAFHDLDGNPKKMAMAFEKFYLGIPLSGSEVDLHYNPQVSIKCRNFTRLSSGTTGKLGVVIERVKEIKDKNGNRMCFLTVSDDTYMIDSVVVFSSYYKHSSWIIEEGKPVLISGKKDKESFIARKIQHL